MAGGNGSVDIATLEAFLWGMAFMAVLHYLFGKLVHKVRKDGMAKIQLIGTEPFDHAGHRFVAQFKRIDGYNVKQIGNYSAKRDHGMAQISAVHNALHSLTRDGKDIDLGVREDGGTNIPADYDPEKPRGSRFVMDVLLRFLVNKYQIFLVEEWEDSFGSYADAVEEDEENPTTATATTGSVSEISRSSQTTERVG